MVGPVTSCMDGPSGARGLLLNLANGATAVMCSAFDAARWPLAQMGSANETTTKLRPRPAIACIGFTRSSDRPIIISCSSSCTLALAIRLRGHGNSGRPYGDGLLASIRFPGRHHGPRDAGHLVGQSHRRDLARLALQQCKQPSRSALAPWLGVADHRHRADDQQLSEPLVAGPADAAQTLTPASRVLLWHETQPGREVPPGGELGLGLTRFGYCWRSRQAVAGMSMSLTKAD